MATATALGLLVALRVHDKNQAELLAADYLSFINLAIDDLVASGWLLPQTEDESIVLVDNDFDYDIPAGFAYIRRLYVADSDSQFPSENEVPHHQFRLSLDVAGTPEIYFLPDSFDMLVSGRNVKIVGQKRPSQSVAGSATIEPGMEAFVRERAVSYAAEFLAAGVSELSQYRQRLAEVTWAKSEKMLGNHPMEFRVKPSSLYVPGR